MNDIEFKKFKLEALLRAYYFDLYLRLERKIKDVFYEELKVVDSVFKNKLYFYYGYKHKSTEFFDYENDKLVKEEKPFDINESFREFSIVNIIKMIRKKSVVKKFDFEIPSLNKPTIKYPFYEIVIKLIEMRNSLAHVGKNASFKDKHIIELLSSYKLGRCTSFRLEDDLVFNADIYNKQIFSNLIYMEMILNELEK